MIFTGPLLLLSKNHGPMFTCEQQFPKVCPGLKFQLKLIILLVCQLLGIILDALNAVFAT